MTIITFAIDIDNAAFEDRPAALSALLYTEADRAEMWGGDLTELHGRTIRDINGNTVGHWAVIQVSLPADAPYDPPRTATGQLEPGDPTGQASWADLLSELPTLCVAQASDLKVDRMVAGIPTRVWLARSEDDGAAVAVEQYDGQSWRMVGESDGSFLDPDSEPGTMAGALTATRDAHWEHGGGDLARKDGA